jgi:uncharacterized protein with PQ loop repeat
VAKLVLLLLFIGAALAGGLWWNHSQGTLAPVSWAVGVSAVATFFTTLVFLPPAGKITKSGTRNAITSTFIVTYFLLLGLFVFFEGETGNSPITDTLVTNFTFLMGVVIAFHFGTTAYEKVAQLQAVAKAPDKQNEIAAAGEASEVAGTTEGSGG